MPLAYFPEARGVRGVGGRGATQGKFAVDSRRSLYKFYGRATPRATAGECFCTESRL